MSLDLRGRVAVVTGASSGIGRAIAERFAAEGLAVALAARSRDALEDAAATIRKANPESDVLVVPVDVRRETEVRALATRVSEWKNAVDVLVNAAGVGLAGRVASMSTNDWDEVMETNLRGPFLVTRELLPLLRAPGPRPRAVVNIASVSGLDGRPGLSAYCASKFGLRGFSLSLASEVSDEGIRVTAVNPGYVDTPMVEGASAPASDMMRPAEVAEAVLGLVRLPAGALVDELTLWPARLYSS
ncbi:MAG TPA: SDR family oxidoreductase [Candidatus Thermoplasmatota archaeon]|nr:SDR family oxidoreductase [Candidatus Thermoplasmatota archaeon]